MSEKQKKKNKIIGISIGILVVLLVVISSTYAYWQITRSQDGSNDIIAACLDIDMESVDGTFGINPAWPISDSEGMKLQGYTFKVTNNCEEDVSYIIGMDSLEADGEYLSYDSIKISIDNNESVIYGRINDKIDHIEANDSYQIRESQKLNTAVVKGNTSNTHNVKVWISSESTLEDQGKVFSGRIFITGGQAIDNDKPIGKIVASGDISRTKTCNGNNEYDWDCENLVDHNNDVKYNLFDNGTLNIYGSGDIETFEIQNEVYAPLIIKVMKDYAVQNNIELTEIEKTALDNIDGGAVYLMAAMSEDDKIIKKISEGQITSYENFLVAAPSLIGQENFELLLSVKNKFSDFPKEINVNIESGITSIGDGTFNAMIINEVNIPSSVKNTYQHSFGHSYIEVVNISEGIEIIGSQSFQQSNIGTIKLPDSLQKIDGDGFGNSKINLLELPNNNIIMNRLDNSVFGYSTISELIIPENVVSIDSRTFLSADISNTIVKLYGPERTIEGLDLTQFKDVQWNYQEE